MIFDTNNAPEPSRHAVASAFGDQVADTFEQIRGKQKMSHFDEMRIAIDARYRGRTITRAEADELIGMINRCVPPEPEALEFDPYNVERWLWEDPSESLPHLPSCRVVSEKDYDALLEAFRRGQNSKRTT